MNVLTIAEWSPYVAGAGIGLLGGLAFLLSDKPIGCSTPFARASAWCARALRGSRAMQNPYFAAHPPGFTWDAMLVIGMLLGACCSAWLSGDLAWRRIPDVWRDAAGGVFATRAAAALAGGVIMGFGARWADGCTSGHGISGTMQLAVSGWLAVICFFAGGIAGALLLFKVLLPLLG